MANKKKTFERMERELRSLALAAEDTLPNKPSELLELALRDVDRIPAKKNGWDMQVRASQWVGVTPSLTPNPSVCNVCLAGAVIIGELGVDPAINKETKMSRDVPELRYFEIVPGNFKPSIQRKLYALNYMRAGRLWSALEILSVPQVKIYEFLDRFYPENKARIMKDAWYTSMSPMLVYDLFKRDMEFLLARLKACDL